MSAQDSSQSDDQQSYHGSIVSGSWPTSDINSMSAQDSVRSDDQQPYKGSGGTTSTFSRNLPLIAGNNYGETENVAAPGSSLYFTPGDVYGPAGPPPEPVPSSLYADAPHMPRIPDVAYHGGQYCGQDPFKTSRYVYGGTRM